MHEVEDPQQRLVAGPPRPRHRLGHQRGPVVVAQAVELLEGEEGEQVGAVAVVVGRYGVEGPAQHLDPVVVDGPEAALDAPVVQPGRRDQQLGVAGVVPEAGRSQQRVAEGGLARLPLGGAEGQEQVAERAVVVAVPELEGPAVPAAGLVGRQSFRGLGAGRLGRGRGAAPVVGVAAGGGDHPVVRPLGRAARGVQPFERLGGPAVHPGPAGGREPVVQRVLDDGVGEREPAGLAGHLVDEQGRLGPLEGIEDGVAVGVDERLEQAELDVAPEHGAGGQDAGDVVAEAGDAMGDDVADVVGQVELGVGLDPLPVLVAHDHPRLGQVAQELDGEEGVAAALAVHDIGDAGEAEVMPGRGLDEGAGVGGLEPPQRQPLDAGAHGAGSGRSRPAPSPTPRPPGPSSAAARGRGAR